MASFTAGSLPDLSGSWSNLSFRSCRSPTCSSTRNIRAKYLEQLQSFMTEIDASYCSSVGDMENHASNLWNDLQQENKLPLGGPLMNSCEQELQELVRQIDVMVKSRESQLRQHTRRIQKQMEAKTKECLQQKMTIDENLKKIMTLHGQLDDAVKEKQDVVLKYETQLSGLKTEASRLRNEHERLHKKYQRKMRDVEKRGKTTSEQDLEKDNEIKRITNRLMETEQQNQNYELKNQELLSQMENLDRTCKELSGKYQQLESKEHKFNSEKNMLEDQLNSAMGTISAKAMKTERVELAEKIKVYEKQKIEDNQEIQSLHDQVLKKDEELTDLNNTEVLLKEAVCAFKVELANKANRISQLEQQLETLKSNPSEELQNKLANGQMDSLRSENHLLRKALIQQNVPGSSGQIEPVKEDPNFVEELTKIKNEKLALEKQVNELSTRLKNCEIDFRQKVQEVMKIAQQAVEDIKNKHSWKIQKTIEETEKKLHLQFEQHQQLAKQQAEEAIKSLKQRIDYLEKELSEEKEKKTEEEPDVMSELSKVVDNIVQQATPKSNKSDTIKISTQKENATGSDYSTFSIEKVKLQEFLGEEDMRRKEWEDNFDKRLQEIWQKTEATLQQFIDNA